MPVDFDRLVNGPAFRHFGRTVTYHPGADNPGAGVGPFTVTVVRFFDDLEPDSEGTVGQVDCEAVVDIRRSDLPASVEVTADDGDYAAGDRIEDGEETWRIAWSRAFEEGVTRLYLRKVT
jgi:hypothetical protein